MFFLGGNYNLMVYFLIRYKCGKSVFVLVYIVQCISEIFILIVILSVNKKNSRQYIKCKFLCSMNGTPLF